VDLSCCSCDKLAPEADRTVYRFGMFELDSRARELRKHGVRVKLQDQPLRILLLLVQHPGQVVTREQIQGELWPAGTYVDYENAINSSVRKLREALGDSPSNPRFIETLSRRGYRLLVPVSRDGAEDTPPEPPPPAVRRVRWPVLAAAGLLVVATIAAILLNRGRSPREFELPPGVPLTTYPGAVCCPSFSPDGTRVAFTWNGRNGDNFDIYVKLIGQGEPVRLTTDTAPDSRPAWSPDGSWIAFERFGQTGVSILVIPAMGGPEREVTHVAPRGDNPSLCWSVDGKSLFASDSGPGTPASITRISVESGEKERITSPPSNGGRDASPVVSPDGLKLAFAREMGVDLDEVCVLSLEPPLRDRTPQRITAEPKQIDGLAWTPDGRDLVFSSPRGSAFALWQVPADGRSPPRFLTGAGDNSHQLAISVQGRLIYSTRLDARHLWRLPIGSDFKAPAVPFLASTRVDSFPHYSPDGKRVAFESARSGNHEIWVCNEDGSALVQLTSLGAWSGTPSWSPDGDKIAFDSNSPGNWDIFVVSSRGGKPAQLTTNRADETVPTWSRDGKWIYFSSVRTGRSEIWKIPTSGGSEIQITKNGGFQAFEAPGGKELYFTPSTSERAYEGIGVIGGGLWRKALPDGAEQQVAGPLWRRNFETGARGVYFIEESPAGATLKFLQYGSSSADKIAALGGTDYWGITISPDERVAIYSHFEITNSELMLVEGFGLKP